MATSSFFPTSWGESGCCPVTESVISKGGGWMTMNDTKHWGTTKASVANEKP
jgi:hypothetical protein